MIDIVSDLAKKKSEVISLYELITTIQEQSDGASIKDIAEWLVSLMDNDPDAPSLGILTVGGGFEDISLRWGSSINAPHPSLHQLLIELYRNHGEWPGDIPF